MPVLARSIIYYSRWRSPHVCLIQDGIASPEDVDKAVVEGLGMRYSFMGVFETMHINADGMEDYCKRYVESSDD